MLSLQCIRNGITVFLYQAINIISVSLKIMDIPFSIKAYIS